MLDQLKSSLLEIFTQTLNETEIQELNQRLQFIEYIKLEEKIMGNNLKLSAYHFCLALILDKTEQLSAYYHYEQAQKYDKNNPQICLCFAYYLIRSRNRKAIEFIKKIDFSLSIKLKKSISALLQYIILIKGPQIPLNSKNKQPSVVQYQQSFAFLLTFANNFHNKNIQQNYIGQSNDIHYIQLATIALLQNKYDECLKFAYQIIDSKQVKILLYLGFIFSVMKKYEKSVGFYQDAILINPYNIQAYSLLFYNLTALKLYKEAKECAQIIRSLAPGTQKTQIILARSYCLSGNHQQALIALKKLLKENDNSHLSVDIWKKIGNEYLHLDRYNQAIQIYIRLIEQYPSSHAYNILGMCYRKKKESANSIKLFKLAIKNDCLSTNSYVYLSEYASKYQHFKKDINSFMDKLKSQNLEDIFIKFNVSLYYYLSKQQSRQFYSILSQFIDKDNQQDSQEPYQNVVSVTLIKYLEASRQIQSQNFMLSLIIGILSRAKGNTVLSHSCFMNLIRKYKSGNSYNFKMVFRKLSQRLLKQGAGAYFFTFLQFITIQMIEQCPKYAMQCFNNVLSHVNSNFDKKFRKAFIIKLQKEVEKMDQIAIFDKSRMIADQIKSINVNQRLIVNPNELYKAIYRLSTTIRKIQSCLADNTLIRIVISEYLIIQTQYQELNLWSNIVGIKLDIMTYRSDDYTKIKLQINKEEQSIKQKILANYKLYSSNSNKETFLKIMFLFLSKYFYNNFIKNQMIKLIINTFHPIIPSGDKGHCQLALILQNFKNNPCYDPKDLRKNICGIFQQRKQHEQLQNSNIDISQSTSNTSFEPQELKIIEDTKSHCGYQDQNFDIIQDKGLKNRKYSDSKNISPIQYEFFCKELQENRQVIAIKGAMMNYQNKQSFKQSKDFYQNSQLTSLIQAQSHYNEQQQSEQQQKQQQQSQQEFDQHDIHPTIYLVETNTFSERCEKHYYKQFYQLLYLNTFYIIQYLSKRQNYKPHIAKTWCVQYQIFTQQKKLICKFTAKTQKGANHFSRLKRIFNRQQPQIEWLWKFEPNRILKWIEDIALGIFELQCLGIYHADLLFRNTIVIIIKDQWIFKIIDFDKAFQVVGTFKNKAYQTTRKMIKFWLNFNYDNHQKGKAQKNRYFQNQQFNEEQKLEIIQYIINRRKINSKVQKNAKVFQFSNDENYELQLLQKFLNIKEDYKTSNKKDQLIIINKCMKLLQQHMRKSHLQQYVDLADQLLQEERWKDEDQLVKLKIECTLKQLVKLKNNAIGYQSFANEIKKIREGEAIHKDDDAFVLQQLVYQVGQM